ncbi:uncharacterized protein DSM5745_05795 [Aspergillus mulundensis]|uniref:HAD-like protein n=1 Tax=Aspergillus mulundensis TaxID=1810919 RepID=A0A3D8RY06_9EURO|nr:Uncharacterized protein DSM5745_05795 [Aspergillus mulundensis]RDW78943.1 Uncharacterized protein DSM5745_05795 [Aspergillus mulundensis]
MSPPPKAIILDLWDILLSRLSPTSARIPRGVLKDVFSSDICYSYECGKLTDVEFCQQVAVRHSLDGADVVDILQQTRKIAIQDESLIQRLRTLKNQYGKDVHWYAMLNIAGPNYAVIRDAIAEWAIFDRVFTSSDIGMRKPDLCFYRHVLHELGQHPGYVVFVESDPDNVLSARSVGGRVVPYEDASGLARSLHNLLGDTVKRGHEFLRANAGRLDSITNTGVTIRDNFTQLLILEVTGDRDLIYLEEHPRTWNFFIGQSLLTTTAYPDDFDTTCAALTVLKPDRQTACSVLDELASHVNDDGIILTYFDRSRPRIDPVVCVNVLRAFYEHGRGHELQPSLHWVHEVLKTRAYVDGTRYYPTAEAFLYFVARLLQCTQEALLQREFSDLLRQRVKERIGKPGDALCLAMRLLACQYVGVPAADAERDVASLRAMQDADGGWEPGCVYRYGKTDIRIGSRGLATALAVKALSQAEDAGRAGRGGGEVNRESLTSLVGIPSGLKTLYWGLLGWVHSYPRWAKTSP